MRYEKPVRITDVCKKLGRKVAKTVKRSPAIAAAVGVAAVCTVVAVSLVVGARHAPTGDGYQYTQEDLENLAADDSYDASGG